MAQVRPSAALYAYINNAWVELDDVQPWDASWGISGSGPLDFVADTGTLKFSLNNRTGQYTPGGPSALAGFRRGLAVKRVVTFEGEEHVTFRGYIDEIGIQPSNKDKTVSVTCVDWMDYAARHPIVNPGVESNILSDEVLNKIVTGMDVQPQQTDFAEGVYVFQTAFDVVTTKTTAYSEFGRVALSDLTHIYLQSDETLVAENFNTRHGWVEPGEIPLANADSDLLLKEDGDLLLLETGDSLILNETAAVTFDSSIIEAFDAPYGDMVINRVVTQAYPRKLDASAQALFELGEDDTIEIATGKSYTLEGTWTDPEGGNSINAQDHVTPVATTDYLANTAEDGSGSNITTDLEITSWKPGTEGFTAILKNNNAALMYVTRFSPRAIGIYQKNPLVYTVRDSVSIAEFEAQSITLNQKYRRNARLSAVYAGGVVLEYSQPKTVLKSIYFCANKSPTLMMAYLHTDIGALRTIDIDELGINSNYYVQGIEDKYDDGLIWVKWILKEHPSIQAGLTDIAMEFVSANSDAVDFGPLIRVSHPATRERTFAAWINADLLDGTRSVISVYSDTGGVLFAVSESAGQGEIYLYSNRHDSANGVWVSDTTDINTGSWFHVVCCYDHTSANNDPIMYINGVSQTVVEEAAPAGNVRVEIGTHVVVGNNKTITVDYTEGFDGKIYDARIYDRLITAAEATTLYNSGTPDPSLVTDGLIFQAFAVETGRLSEYEDVTLDDTVRVFENQFRSAGIVHGTPIGRAAP